jgi:hypothetical protein
MSCANMHIDEIVGWVGFLRNLPKARFLSINRTRKTERTNKKQNEPMPDLPHDYVDDRLRHETSLQMIHDEVKNLSMAARRAQGRRI